MSSELRVDKIIPTGGIPTGGGGGTIGGMSDVDLTDTSQGGIADGALLIYDASNTKFVPTNVLNNVTINGGSF